MKHSPSSSTARPTQPVPADTNGTDPRDPRVARAVTLARGLDVYMVDPLVGFFLPGAGDIVTAGAGLYIVAVAFQLKLPAVVIARMFVNLAIDMLLGAVPILGDLFDWVHRANVRNAKLLEARHEGGSTLRDWLVVAGAALLFAAALAIPIAIIYGVVTSVGRLAE